MLALCGTAETAEEGRRRIAAALDDGSALERFAEVVTAQGGDARVLEDPLLLPRASVEVFRAQASGQLAYADVRALGLAIAALGGGRRVLSDSIDHAVGLVAMRAAGEEVSAGEALFEIHHREGRGLEAARAHLRRAFELGAAGEPTPLIASRLAI